MKGITFKTSVLSGLLAIAAIGLSLAHGQWTPMGSHSVIVMTGDGAAFPLMRAFGFRKTDQQLQMETQQVRSHLYQSFMQSPPPQSANLMDFASPVRDQGQRGTCVAFASVALMELEANRASNHPHGNVDLSEQYAYWANKVADHYNPNAEGSEVLPMLETLTKHGTVAEQAWPYEPIAWYEDQNHPDCVTAYKQDENHVPTECVTNGNPGASASSAQKMVLARPAKVSVSPEQIVALVAKGVPVEIGVDVYASSWGFNDGPIAEKQRLQGMVRMPAPGDDQPIGGHAVLVTGYDMSKKVFFFKNSWGTVKWGSRGPVAPGYGVIPFEYVRRYGEAGTAILGQPGNMNVM